jgi:hypothetical protein
VARVRRHRPAAVRDAEDRLALGDRVGELQGRTGLFPPVGPCGDGATLDGLLAARLPPSSEPFGQFWQAGVTMWSAFMNTPPGRNTARISA